LSEYKNLTGYILAHIERVDGDISSLNIKNMYDYAISEFEYSKPIEVFRKYVRNVKWKHNERLRVKAKISPKLPKSFDLMEYLKDRKVVRLFDLCDEAKMSPNSIMSQIDVLRKIGYEIVVDNNIVSISESVSNEKYTFERSLEEKELSFAVVSDMHFGSKACQITALNEFCHICSTKGIKHILVPGDIVSGYKVYTGQELDVYCYTAKEQEETVLKNLPVGFEWYMLGGNHDYSFLSKGGGINIIRSIVNKRPDIKFVGFDEAVIPLINGVDCKLWHPSGGQVYSVSYRVQKSAEQLAFDELNSITNGVKNKPSIKFLFSGHLHIQMQAMFGGIMGMQCGCFEGKTNYLKRKGLVPHIGGYIINANMNSNNNFSSFDARFYMFPEIENDWKNYSHNVEKTNNTIIRPILE
jgi:hypothetical protein